MEPSKIGDWMRISVLGSGGFGIVSLWRCSQTNDSIAVKKCKLQCSTSLTPKHKERWCNEVQIMKELNHPNIVKHKPMPPSLEIELNKFNPTKLPLLPMEYCQKGNLRHILTEPSNMCGLEESAVKNILSDISSAVHYLHSNKITHRDIKPENIVLQDCPTREHEIIYKLIDLGYAKELNDSTVSFVGTFHYLAPEIFANKNYDCTVDYWSLGIVAFEIICGVLPFMPRLPPIKRYALIKEKGPDQICVYKNNMGNIQYSSELFQENRISSCLKIHMEVWLRTALNFDPELRSEQFQNSRDFFQQLDFILKKKILRIFVMYRYQFYSYEFDECTSLSTVRQWITRDTDISEEDQLLLGKFQFSQLDGNTLIANCFVDENYELYLVKRNAYINIEKHYNPRLVKLMFDKANAGFSWQEVKAIYSHCLHYILRDLTLATAFQTTMDLYLEQANIGINKILKNWEISREKCIKLTEKLKEFNDNVKKTYLGRANVDDLQKNKYMKFYDALQKSIDNENLFALNIQEWLSKLHIMKMININDLIQFSQIEECFNKARICFQKTAVSSDQKKDGMKCSEMLRIVCKVMKLKDSLITNKNIEDHSRSLDKAIDYLESLSSWSTSFDDHVDSLHETIDLFLSEVKMENIKIETLPEIRDASTKNDYVNNDPLTNNAVLTSQVLITRAERLVEECIDGFRTIQNDIGSYIQDISSML